MFLKESGPQQIFTTANPQKRFLNTTSLKEFIYTLTDVISYRVDVGYGSLLNKRSLYRYTQAIFNVNIMSGQLLVSSFTPL